MTQSIEIRVSHSQVGMLVEARNGGDWQPIQLTKYQERNSPTVRQYSTCIDPARDESDCVAEAAPNENYVPADESLLAGLTQLWIEGGARYYGWL